MNREHEPIRLPTWRTPLRAFETARDAYAADPTEANLAIAQRLGQILTEELWRPGRFELGHTVSTIGSHDAMVRALHLPEEFLLRHKHGDWGVVPEEDALENERALREGSRLFSAYDTRVGERLWVITEWDRSTTTLLLPDEY